MSQSTLAQNVNPMNALSNPQQFFVRALTHCYTEIEELLKLISKTPHAYRKSLLIKKARLIREAKYIKDVKLKGVQV